MGALPIVLALAGFVLLWSIVNYNSFTDKRNTIQRIIGQRADLLRVQSHILTKIAALFKNHHLTLPEYFTDLIKNPDKPAAKPQMEASLAQLNSIMNMHPVISNNADFQELRKNLVSNTNQLLQLQNALTAAVAGYNKQTTSMPYRIIATLFGFKPIKDS